MGWERRGNGRYYYRKQRIGQQVKSQYVGSGELAEAIATLDEMEQLKRQLEQEEQRALRQRLEADKAMDRQLNELWGLTRRVVTAVLLTNGYHTHKGQWRKWQKS